ncbi:hypothetical protein BU17DRAFT_100116 [Hysterangium stoloniferum]|nr:hypothetical protein BU17DRAFT_100116 [Hysterangium stoloniferum]
MGYDTVVTETTETYGLDLPFLPLSPYIFLPPQTPAAVFLPLLSSSEPLPFSVSTPPFPPSLTPTPIFPPLPSPSTPTSTLFPPPLVTASSPPSSVIFVEVLQPSTFFEELPTAPERDPSPAQDVTLNFPPHQVMLQCAYYGLLVYDEPMDDKWDMYYASQISEEEVMAITQDYQTRYPTMPPSIATWIGRYHGILVAQTLFTRSRTLGEVTQLIPEWSEELMIPMEKGRTAIKRELFIQLVDLLQILHILERSLYERSPEISFAYFSLQSRLLHVQQKCDKMMAELLSGFDEPERTSSSSSSGPFHEECPGIYARSTAKKGQLSFLHVSAEKITVKVISSSPSSSGRDSQCPDKSRHPSPIHPIPFTPPSGPSNKSSNSSNDWDCGKGLETGGQKSDDGSDNRKGSGRESQNLKTLHIPISCKIDMPIENSPMVKPSHLAGLDKSFPMEIPLGTHRHKPLIPEWGALMKFLQMEGNHRHTTLDTSQWTKLRTDTFPFDPGRSLKNHVMWGTIVML